MDNDKLKLLSNLPSQIDSINISFDSNRVQYVLHISNQNYILRNLNTRKSYDITQVKDSLSDYIYELFIYENIKPILRINKSDSLIFSEGYKSLLVTKYGNHGEVDYQEISIEDNNSVVEFSDEYNKLMRFLFFICKSPDDINRRLEARKRFQKAMKNK